jgi:transposase-like protein
MKQLRFNTNSSQEWLRCKQFFRNNFWDNLEAWKLREAKRMLQAQIYEEFDMQIGAPRYARTDTRAGFRCGYRSRDFEILGGLIKDLTIPRARKLDIRFSIFDKWERVQKKLLTAMTTAYLLGKSSATAVEIIEAFGQSRFSRSFLQKLVKNFEKSLKQYKNQEIKEEWPYVFIDGMLVDVHDVYYKEQVVIFAYGVDDKHNNQLLGWVVADTEDEIAVRSLLIDLQRRGFKTPDLFVTDESKGIRSALRLEYPHVPWQLCSFHKTQTINRNLTDCEHRKAIMREAGDIYQLSTTRSEAIKRFKAFKRRWRTKEPKAVRLFCNNFEDTLRYFDFPKEMWISIRTTNPIEQYLGKLRRWTSKFSYFHGRANLELALFTYLCYKSGRLVPDCLDEAKSQMCTLSIA